ncbi:hypothetical protein AGMMS49983_16960 [Clostridia bacterium]|nr:hypothetical protein AGMMS49983_16960 [Clostridia bacterium]
MNSKERILTAFEHKEADRVPCAELHLMSPISSELLGREAITGEGGWTIWTQKEMVASGRRDEYVERLKVDTVDAFTQAGLDNILMELDPPKDTQKKITDLDEAVWIEEYPNGLWAKFKYEKIADTVLEIDSSEKQDGASAVKRHLDTLEESKFYIDEGCFESTKYAVEKAGNEKFIMAKVPNLFPSGRSWYTYFMEMIYIEPDLAERMFDVYTKYALAAVKRYAEIGVDCVMIASDWAYNAGPIFAPDVVAKYMAPQVQTIADYCHAHDVLVLKHTDGNIWMIEDIFFNMGIDGYQGMEPNVGMRIAEVKAKYGDHVTLMGNVDCGHTLPFGTKEEVIEETTACVRDGAKGGGYILSSANSIAHPTPLKNFLTMIETVHKYGVYPIEF